MGIDPFGDHALTCKQHTGSIRGHNHLMDVVACLRRDSKIGPVRLNHKVSTIGDGTRKQKFSKIKNKRWKKERPTSVSSEHIIQSIGKHERTCTDQRYF